MVETLIALLREGRAPWEAARALERLGAYAVPALLAAVGDRGGRRARPLMASALGEIALRDPAPGLRAALPILGDLARSFWSGRELRNACRTAIKRIERATAARKDLPVPAGPLPAPWRRWERLLRALGLGRVQ